MQPLDDGVPFATFIMRVVGLVVNDQQATGAAGDSFGKVHLLLLLRGRLRAEHGSYRVRFIVLRAVSSFVKLMNVGEEENSFRMRSLPFAPHDAIEVPENVELFRADGVFAENFPGCEISLEAFQYDHVGRDKQKRLGIILGDLVLLPHGIEILPGYGQRHDFGLAAAGGHFCAIARETVFRGQMQILGVLCVAFEQVLPAADFLNFPDVNECLDRLPLKFVILEGQAGSGLVTGFEPVIEQDACRIGGAVTPAGLP